jgi:hypothetical protein
MDKLMGENTVATAVDEKNQEAQEMAAKPGEKKPEEAEQTDLLDVFGDVPLSAKAQKEQEKKEAKKKAAEEKKKREEAQKKARAEAAKKEKPPEDLELFFSDGKERRFFPAGTTLEAMKEELEEEFWNLKGEDVTPAWEVVETPEGKKVKVQFFSKHKKKGWS